MLKSDSIPLRLLVERLHQMLMTVGDLLQARHNTVAMTNAAAAAAVELNVSLNLSFQRRPSQPIT